MKKSLIAVAVASVIAAPAAMADTTLYGQAHASLDFLSADTAAAGTEDSALALANNSSRMGIKGSHKLTEGLSAVYKYEIGVNLDGEGDASGFSARNRIVGLSGGFGTFVVGKHDTPMKGVRGKADLFWSTQLGTNRQIVSQGNGVSPGWDLRPNNVIGYISPSFGPVSIFAAYVTDHGVRVAGVTDDTSLITENNNFDAVSIALNVGSGKPYYFGVGYETHNVKLAAPIPATLTDSESIIRVVGAYKIGPVKLTGLWQSSTDEGFTTNNDRDSYGVGAAYTFGKNTVKAQYYLADDIGSTTDTGGNLIAVGWDYKMSKTTDLYAQYAAVSNDASTTEFGFSGGTGHGERASASADETASGISLGIRVNF